MYPIALFADPEHDQHLTPEWHPERSDRVPAALAGLRRANLLEACTLLPTRPATIEQMTLAHTPVYLEALLAFCMHGGGEIDGDTFANGMGSWDTAADAAGAGLCAIEALKSGAHEVAFCGYRPPGHHATAGKAMGFCLVNNVAVAAASLAAEGERVAIIDWDVHHGNGTQDIFYNDPNVLYISTHQAGAYPGTGHLRDTGGPEASMTNLNLPLPVGATGDLIRACFDEVVLPVAEMFAPTWVLVSAGFDAHRDDPLADLQLTSADFADLAARVLPLAGKGRTLFLLEGGYDLRALGDSVAASLASAIGETYRPEAASNGGPTSTITEAARQLWGL
jgi:acetoin utilization deacetylase AcuC-like enzyme